LHDLKERKRLLKKRRRPLDNLPYYFRMEANGSKGLNQKGRKGYGQMEIKWLTFANSPKRHAFPVDEGKYGGWAICGRVPHGIKAQGNAPLCRKCLEFLKKHSTEDLESKRMLLKIEMDLDEEHGS
jgi:hypothetical protein